MVTAYAAKEQKRYHEKAEVDEKSMEDFREEIKGKTKREQIRKEQKKSKSRLSFEDESKGMISGSGMAKGELPPFRKQYLIMVRKGQRRYR